MRSCQLLLLLFLAIPTAARADGAFLDATIAAGVAYLQYQANASTPVLYQNQTRAVGGPQWLRVRVLVWRAASG